MKLLNILALIALTVGSGTVLVTKANGNYQRGCKVENGRKNCRHGHGHAHAHKGKRLVIKNNSEIDVVYTTNPTQEPQTVPAGERAWIALPEVSALTIASAKDPSEMMSIDVSAYQADADNHPHQKLHLEITGYNADNDEIFTYKNPEWVQRHKHHKHKGMWAKKQMEK